MKKRNRAIGIMLSVSVLLCSGLLFSSCSGREGNQTENTSANDADLPDESSAQEALDNAELTADSVKYTKKDLNTEYDAENDGFIRFGDTITASEGVTIENNIVTVTKSGTYLVSGESDEAQLRIELAERESVHLVFSGVSISCSTGIPLYVKSTSKLIITLADDTENSLIDSSPALESDTSGAEETEAENPCAALYSKEDLTINGNGSLTVQSKNQSGIITKDLLKLINASVTVVAKDKGIKGKDGVAIRDAVIKITAGGDGIKATNSEEDALGFILIESGEINITADQDGIQAEGVLSIKGGAIQITAGGGSSAASAASGRQNDFRPGSSQEGTDSTSKKGLKAGTSILITGGTISIDSSDDSIHTNGSCIIQGGDFTLSTGDDGVHADQTLTVEGGTIRIMKSYEGLEAAVIYLKGGNAVITASDDGINAASKTSSATYSQEFVGETAAFTNAQNSSFSFAEIEEDASLEHYAGMGGFPGGQGGQSSSSGAVYISGGYFYINASGDGLDSNGLIYMTGGTLLISGPVDNGNGAIDYDGSFTMDGGVLIAAGSSGMAQQPGTDSSAYTLMATFTSQSAGTIVSLRDKDGNDIVTFAPEKAFNNIVICTLDLKKGESYTLYAGGSCTGESENGLYSGGVYTGGTEICTVTIDSTCTVYGSGGGFGGGGQGGFPGGGGNRPGGRR